MVVLAIVRTTVPVTPTDAEGMLDKKEIATLGVGFYDGKWAKKKKDKHVDYNNIVNANAVPFTTWADYTTRKMRHDPDQLYDIADDWYGP